jgi:hypothetical protein
MADDGDINVTITGDSSGLTDAIDKASQSVKILDSGSKVYDKIGYSVESVAKASAEWRKESGMSEKATISLGKGFVDLRGIVGKTAADFKPATEEMRKASLGLNDVKKAAEDTGGGFSGMLGRIGQVAAGYLTVRAAVKLAEEAWSDYSREDAAGRHIGLMEKVVAPERRGSMTDRDTGQVWTPRVGSQAKPQINVEEGIAKSAAAHSMLVQEYEPTQRSLSAVGIHGEKLVKTLDKLADTSRVTGIPMEQLASSTIKVQGNLEATADDMQTVAETGK